MTIAQSTVIAARVYDPSLPSIFGKSKKSERPQLQVIACSCDNCPLLKFKQCVRASLFRDKCPYGTYTVDEGPTQRASSFYGWIKAAKEKHPGVGWLTAPPKRLAFIGEYVYLPYAHMDMCEKVPFLGHSGLFRPGNPFIKREEWTIESVLALIAFRPQAAFGGEIETYQKTEIPLFVSHVRELDSGMWEQIIERLPQLDVAPNYVGRTAKLSTLAYPITIPPKDERYPVQWEWDGTRLRTTSPHAFSDTWGGVRAKSVEIAVVPSKDSAIKVRDNSWVNSDTVFVD